MEPLVKQQEMRCSICSGEGNWDRKKESWGSEKRSQRCC